MLLSGYLLFVSGVLIGRSLAKSWTCDGFPAPQVEFMECGMSSASWVCDPEHLLSVAEVFQINRMVLAIQTMRSCVCEDCGVETRFPNTYLKLAVAVVSDIELTLGNPDAGQVELALFAECLRTSRWQHAGHCQDDVVIVMATSIKNSNATLVSSSSGSGAVEVGVTDSCVDVIIRSNMDDAEQGRYGDALFNIVEGIKNSLAGYHYCVKNTPRPGDGNGPGFMATTTASPIQRVSTKTWIIVGAGIGGFLVLALCCCCCCMFTKSRKK